jgi:hypothetical protein
MKTAVEWLEDEFTKTNYLSEDEFYMKFKQAKEMEKEQKEDFFNAGVRYGSGSVMATEWGEDTEEYNFEQYYNETFKSGKQSYQDKMRDKITKAKSRIKWNL